MLHLLRDIPREIRDQIYEYAFETPSSCVTFRATTHNTFQILPYNPQEDALLSFSPISCIGLLSTCTQIYNEAQRILWRRNSLGLWPGDLFCNLAELPDRTFANVQRVEINLDLMDKKDFEWAKKALERFATWSKEGSLKSITINPIRSEESRIDLKWMNQMKNAMKMRWLSGRAVNGSIGIYTFSSGGPEWSEWMQLLRDAGGDEGYLGHQVQKKVTINTVWDHWEPVEKMRWINKSRWGVLEDMEAVMVDLNKNFGGELWANGKLCYRNQKKVDDVFTMKNYQVRFKYVSGSESDSE